MEDTIGKCSELSNSDIKRDLGMMVLHDISWEAQIDKRATRILGILKNKFYSRYTSLWSNLYVSLVGPHLEYAVQAWNLYLEKDIMKIAKVQIRTSKIPLEDL